MHLLYAYYQSNEEDLKKIDKELTLSMQRMYDMYIYLLLTFEQIVRAAENKIEDRKKKIRPSQEDLNPNLSFVKNKLIIKISESKELNKLSNTRKINWLGVENQEIFRKVFLSVLDSEAYALFMKDQNHDFEQQRAFTIQLFKDSIANSPLLFNFFDEKSIYWVDDLDLCCSMVIKSIKSISIEDEFQPLPLFKDEEDETEFAHDLLRKTIQNDAEYESIISALVSNWETERIAKMDMVMLKMGITELLYFQSVPPKVTLNEYIEISKFYSTPKSNIFINGILDQIIQKFKKEKKMIKSGRGLLD